MAEAAPPPAAPTSFAEFEAAGGKYKAPPAEAKTAEPAAATEETRSEGEPESAAPAQEPETAEPQPTSEKKPAKPKLSLADEHAKLLKEVTELRKQRRELQAPPATPPAPPAAAAPAAPALAQEDDKPPVRPKLSTFPGTLEEYEKAVDGYEEDLRKWQDRQFEKREAVKGAKAEQERITRDYGAKLAEHLKVHPEYDAEIGQTPMSPLMVDIILRQGPALGQVLIDDKDNARRIGALPAGEQIFEMGKLAAALNGRHVPEAEEAAPEPVKVPARVGSGGGSSSALNRPDHGAKSYAEFEAIENRLKKKK